MAKRIKIEVALDNGDAVIASLRKRDFKNALHIASAARKRMILTQPEKEMLSFLAYPAVWTVECAIKNHSHQQSFTDCGNDEKLDELFSRITDAGEKHYEKARIAVMKRILECSASGEYKESGNYKLSENPLEFREFVLLNDRDEVDAMTTILDVQFAHFVHSLDSYIVSPNTRQYLTWFFERPVFAVQSALIKRDYAELKARIESDVPEIWDEMAKRIEEVASRRLRRCMSDIAEHGRRTCSL